ncbi:uncharacterized protein G2W53_039577 [Senna tora]|uniref:Uncharacterized protein n=1 Tax=Senna tora TaxID=362788 RepID=A0A834SQ81_9FABA|nr:uncharacterized protein G2W53_039577 [Senna tora]
MGIADRQSWKKLIERPTYPNGPTKLKEIDRENRPI